MVGHSFYTMCISWFSSAVYKLWAWKQQWFQSVPLGCARSPTVSHERYLDYSGNHFQSHCKKANSLYIKCKEIYQYQGIYTKNGWWYPYISVVLLNHFSFKKVTTFNLPVYLYICNISLCFSLSLHKGRSHSFSMHTYLMALIWQQHCYILRDWLDPLEVCEYSGTQG